MKKMSSERKVKRIIYTAMILIGIALFAPYFYIRVNYNIPPYIFFICIIQFLNFLNYHFHNILHYKT